MIRDFWLSLRRLGKQPLQSVVAVAALALGIGFAAALFSIVDGTLLRKLALPKAARLMFVGRRTPRSGNRGIMPAEFQVWQEHQTSFSALAAWTPYGMVLTGDRRPAELVNGAEVSFPFFRAMGVQPALGRGFAPDEDRENSPRVVVISYDLWKQRYQGDPKILGSVVRLGGDSTAVIGVMPKGFKFPLSQSFWMPLANSLRFVAQRGDSLEVCGRLRDGVTPEAARAQLDSLAYAVKIGNEKAGEAHTVVLPFTAGYTAAARRPLGLMTAAVAGILLISCASVANLLLAKGAQRGRELAVRVALGADRRSLVVAVFSEALLIAALGAVAGLGVAKVCIELYRQSGGLVQAFWADVHLDARALVAVLGVTLGTALLSALVPAYRAANARPGDGLRDQSPGGTSRSLGHWARGLVVVQVTLTCVLLSGTGQMIASVHNLYQHDFGEEPKKVWTSLIILDTGNFPSASSWLQLYEDLGRQVKEIPGVRSMALASHLPFQSSRRSRFEIEGKSLTGEATARWSVVSSGFFQTLGRPIFQGRDFLAGDVVKSPLVALINHRFVRRYFSAENPLGRRIRLTEGSAPRSWATIVGVVPDLYLSWDESEDHPDDEHLEGIYFSLAQRPVPGGYVAIRSILAPADMERAFRQVLARLDPNVPPIQPQTLADAVDQSMADYRTMRTLLAVLGLAALVLAAIGLYGVVAFAVHQRRREIGIRMAIGASRLGVAGLVLRAGLGQVVVGAIAGVAGAAMFSRLLAAFLFGVKPGNPFILGAAVVLLFLVAAIACASPIWRAARTDPLLALRSE
ncbi:MAG: ABC transporter permease [Thermoanaerobaculia bacterium]